ncbi:Protein of unknown function DUF553 [Ignisphaera aggregans DSM 17230]|uniref:Transglutaminase-like domain-containing protein n=1 Tax=Ignisphaera aggregans (strain DSM 17230 / JCM 13409 / AQ1.S1) TaxID=583356 RepID=E0SSV0_IGNAA|nr:Protein of unknown function DUF553 [Ignisphaera aggregans DSM 17230]
MSILTRYRDNVMKLREYSNLIDDYLCSLSLQGIESTATEYEQPIGRDINRISVAYEQDRYSKSRDIPQKIQRASLGKAIIIVVIIIIAIAIYGTIKFSPQQTIPSTPTSITPISTKTISPIETQTIYNTYTTTLDTLSIGEIDTTRSIETSSTTIPSTTQKTTIEETRMATAIISTPTATLQTPSITTTTTSVSTSPLLTTMTTETQFYTHTTETMIVENSSTITPIEISTETITTTLVPTTVIQINETATSTPTIYTPKTYLDLDTVILYENISDFVIEIRGINTSSNKLYIEISYNNQTIYLHALGFPRDEIAIIAQYAFVNKTYAKLIFPLDTIKREVYRLNISSEFYIILPMANKICYANLNNEEFLNITYCKDVVFIQPPTTPSLGYPTFYDVILNTFNETSMNILRKSVYRDSLPNDTRWIIWNALTWINNNIEYDRAKALSPSTGIYDPLTTMKLGKGICSDYAVLTSAILLSANINPVYILTFNTSIGLHAAVGIELNNTLWILDQHLPVIEWDDYKQYVVNITSQIYVYRIWYSHGTSSIEFYRMDREYIDTYPIDAIDQRAIDIVMDIVSRETGMRISRELSTVIHIWGASLKLSLPIIDRDIYVPLDTAYSPIFKEQWSVWLASYIIDLLNKYYLDCIEMHGSFWATIYRDSSYTVVKIYAVPFQVPNTIYKLYGDKLYIEINLSTYIYDPINDIQIFLYTDNSGYCAGIAPPGYGYSIPYINADKWYDNLIVIVSMEKIYSLKQYCIGDIYIVISLKSIPIYAIPIQRLG